MPEKRHRIRSRSGDPVEVGEYTRSKAIKAFCTECMGFFEHPRECTDARCPLYPFRGKTLLAISDGPAPTGHPGPFENVSG